MANDTHTRILDAAGELFSKRGYASVKLRDIAAAVGMRHASLYYYAPGGKEQLFVAVMERNFQQHQAGLTAAIASAGYDLRHQLYAVANWLLSQPPLDLGKMVQGDMPNLDPAAARRLMTLGYDSLRLPIRAALEQAQDQLSIQRYDMAAMALVSMIEGVHHIPAPITPAERQHIGRQLIDMLLDGWLKR